MLSPSLGTFARLRIALPAALIALGVAATGASGAAYTVTPCAAGAVPFPGSQMLSADGGTSISDQCSAGNGLRLTFTDNRILAGQEFGLRLMIPPAYPNARILRLTGNVSFAARSGDHGAFGVIDETNGGYDASNGGSTRPGVPDFGLPPGDAILNQAFGQSPVGPTRSVIWRLASSGTTNFDSAVLGANAVLHGMSVVIDDSTRPMAAAFTKTGLLDGTPQSGKRILTFTAADEDSGAHTAVVLNGATSLGTFSGDCRWVSVQACPAERRIDLVVDTSQLTNGPHTLSITTYDAANNSRTDTSPSFTVANGTSPASPTPTPGASPNPTPIASPAPTGVTPTPLLPPGAGPVNGDPKGQAIVTAGTKSTTTQRKPTKRSVRWGQRVTLSGRLLTAGRTPMPGASLDVTQQLAIKGAQIQKLASITTDADGRYRHTFKATASGTYAVQYPLHVGAQDWSAAAATQLAVSARASLRRSGGGTVRRGVAHRFTGKVEAGAIPAGGARVAIQYHLARGGWLNADVLTTSASGSFTWKHTFRTAGAFRLRARVLADARLAAAPGNSPELRFRVR